MRTALVGAGLMTFALLAPMPPGAVAEESGVRQLVALRHPGQTFLTWTEDATVTGERYHVYRSSRPITTGSLGGAQRLTARWGPLGDDTSRHYLAGEWAPRNFVISDLAAPLGDEHGLFVHTTQESGPAYYAVTEVRGGVEDRSIVPGRNATTAPLQERPEAPMPVLVARRGLGRVYTQFMDYARWNPTLQGYAYNFAVALPRGFDPRRRYPLKLELHAYEGRYRALTQAEYDWPAIHVLPDDPPLTYPGSELAGHTWWYGFAADHDFRTGGVPRTGRVANFTESRMLQTVDQVAAMFPVRMSRIHAFGHSMGASGALSLGLRYGDVFSAIYASEPITDYPASPIFGDEWRRLWGDKATRLQAVNLWPRWRVLNPARFQPGTGVWRWMDHPEQLVRSGGRRTALIMYGHGKDDDVIDWSTQGRPFVGALTRARVPFSAVAIGNQGHSWMGFEGVVHDMVTRGYPDMGDFVLDRGPLPAIGRASGSGPVDPPVSGSQRYNLDISWSTVARPRGPAPVDRPDRCALNVWSRSGRDQSADITVRRSRLSIRAGQRFAWRATALADGRLLGSGFVTADGQRRVTVPGARILAGRGTRLAVWPAVDRAAPATVRPQSGRRELSPGLAWFPVTRDGRVHALSDQLPLSDLTSRQIRFAATHYVGSQKQTLAEIRRLRSVRASFALLHYRLATASGPAAYIRDGDWGSDWAYVRTHGAWFQRHLRTGARLHNRAWDWYLHDVTNPGFRDYWVRSTIRDMRAAKAQGVFADSFIAGIGGLLGEPTGDPRFDGTGALTGPWTGPNWLERLGAFSTVVSRRLHSAPERFLYLPNLGNLTTSWATLRLPDIDGAMLEGFAQDAPGYWADAAEYRAAMNRALALSRAGKLLILQPDLINAQHKGFLVGTYLLLQGRRTYLNITSGDAQGMYWYPEYGVSLGPPSGALPASMAAYDDADGSRDQVYRRDFRDGRVVVNGADGSRTVRIGAGRWWRLVGSGGGAVNPSDIGADGRYLGGTLRRVPVSGAVTLAPGEALILRRAA